MQYPEAERYLKIIRFFHPRCHPNVAGKYSKKMWIVPALMRLNINYNVNENIK